MKKIIENSQKKITKKQKDMETQGGVSIAQKCSIQTEIHPQKFIKFKSKVKTKSNKLTSTSWKMRTKVKREDSCKGKKLNKDVKKGHKSEKSNHPAKQSN